MHDYENCFYLNPFETYFTSTLISFNAKLIKKNKKRRQNDIQKEIIYLVRKHNLKLFGESYINGCTFNKSLNKYITLF